MNRTRSRRGFTLIELLVVVLIIGILAAIAIPQYFKVVERARVAEAHTFISQLKQAQERYLARNGTYLTTTDFTNLDITFPGTSPNFGMRYFSAAVGAGSATGCTAGDPYYNVTLTRQTANAGIAARYSRPYTVVFERCGSIAYPGCTACGTDFAQ